MWKKIVLTGLAVFLLAGTGTVIMIDRITLPLLQAALKSQGFPDAEIASIAIGWRESQISGLSLANDLKVRDLSLRYGLGEGLKPRLLAVDAIGLVVDTSDIEKGAIGVLRRQLAANDRGGGGAGFADDLMVRFDGASLRHVIGGMEATVLAKGSLRRDSGATAFRIEFSADMAMGARPFKASATIDGTLDQAGAYRVEARFRRIDAGDGGNGARVEALAGNILLTGKGRKIDVARGHVKGGLSGLPHLGGGDIQLDLGLSDERLQLTGRASNAVADLRFRLASGLDIQEQRLTRLRARGHLTATPKLKALLPVALRDLSFEELKADVAVFADAVGLVDIMQLDEASWMRKDRFRASFTLEALGLSYPDFLSQTAVLAAFDVTPSEDGLALSLSAPALIEGRLDTALAKRAGAMAEQAKFFLAHPMALTLESANPAQPVARLRYQDYAWRLDGEPDLSLIVDWTDRLRLRSGLSARWTPSAPLPSLLRFKAFDLRLQNISHQGHRLHRLRVAGDGGLQGGRLDFAVKLTGGITPAPVTATLIGATEVSMRLNGWLDAQNLAIEAPKGSVIVSSLTIADDVRLATPLRLSLAGNGVSISGDWRKALSLQGQWQSQPVTVHLPGPVENVGESREVSLAAIRGKVEMRLIGGLPGPVSIDLATDAISLSHDGVVLDDVHAKIDKASPMSISEIVVSVGRATYLRDGLHPPPGTIQATARLQGETVDFTAEAKATDAGLAAFIEGRHDLGGASGQATISIPAVSFARAGLQPAWFADALEPLGEVEGSIAGSTTLIWDADGVDGSASFLLDDLSFVAADVTVAGLKGKLALTGLNPPKTATSQRLTVDLIGTGVPMRDVVVDFQLLSQEPPTPPILQIDHAEARVFKGVVSLDDMPVDVTATTRQMSLKLAEIGLADLARVVDIEGLSGRGRLSGVLPITIVGDKIAVTKGQLRSSRPGVIRISSPVTKRVLGGAVEEMDLLLKIIENLEYEALSVDLDKNFDGETQFLLEITGRNPEVEDGRPVHLKIGLEGNLDRVLDTVLAALRLSERTIGATVKRRGKGSGGQAK